MTTEKILQVADRYRQQLKAAGIPKKRMDPKKALGSLLSHERLAHAHFLLDGIVEYTQDPGKLGKANRHLSFVQVILSFEGWYTLEDIMNHNRPDKE